MPAPAPRILAALAVAAAPTLGSPAPAVGGTTAGDPVPATAITTWADIQATPGGYRFRSARHDNHLTVTLTAEGLRLEDTATDRLSSYPAGCEEVEVADGIAAVCAVPADVSAEDPLLLEVAPRRGDDLVDAGSVPATVELAVLADAGADVVRTGAGDDFVNGASGRERVHGGAGDDWIRTGLGRDRIRGGDCNDRLVGVEKGDVLRGGAGDDELGGGPGDDRLYGGPGLDEARCSTGTDVAYVEEEDLATPDCETVQADPTARGG